MAKPRWVIFDDHTPVIADADNVTNFLFIASSGFGTSSRAMRLAEKVVDFLNSLPAEETILPPSTLESEPGHYPPTPGGQYYPKEEHPCSD